MLKSEDLEISPEEALKLPELFKRLRAAYFSWKETSQLPNGEVWKPEKEANGDE